MSPCLGDAAQRTSLLLLTFPPGTEPTFIALFSPPPCVSLVLLVVPAAPPVRYGRSEEDPFFFNLAPYPFFLSSSFCDDIFSDPILFLIRGFFQLGQPLRATSPRLCDEVLILISFVEVFCQPACFEVFFLLSSGAGRSCSVPPY